MELILSARTIDTCGKMLLAHSSLLNLRHAGASEFHSSRYLHSANNCYSKRSSTSTSFASDCDFRNTTFLPS